MIAKTPPPPYYAVIFSSVRTTGDNGYSETSEQMVSSVAGQDGYLGMETAGDEPGGDNNLLLERPWIHKKMEGKS